MKKSLVIHPFLFAIFPILFLFSHNVEQVSFSETLLPSTIVLGVTVVLILLSRLIFKNNKKAGIIVSIFLVLFFSYGWARDAIWQISNFSFIGRHRYVMLIWGMLFTCSVYFVIRTRRDLHNLTRILNVVAFSLVAISVINIGAYEFKSRALWEDSRIWKAEKPICLGKADILPDIYYVILDGYASSSTLKEIYDYDNHEFTDYLTDKGFRIASESRSNYATTFLSLASSLNMEYVNYLSDKIGIESKDRAVPYRMIKNSKVMQFLKSKGYKFIHFSSGWGATNSNNYADLDVQCGSVNEFLMVLIQTTMLRPFEKYLIADDNRKRVICTFSKLAEVHRIEGQKFVFAHIIPPHPPYLFGANGEPVAETKLEMHGGVWKQKVNYLNQLIFVNKKVEMLVEEILSKSEVSPIIILQADHGTASTLGDADARGWECPTENMLRERAGILNAYYLPQSGNDVLYESISPVNTFRVVFNFYFDTNYELLTDQSYFSTYEYPYKFINVTDKVKYD